MVIVDAPAAGGGLAVRREAAAAVLRARMLTMKTAMAQEERAQAPPALGIASTPEERPLGASASGTDLDTNRVAHMGERGEQPPPQLQTGRMQKQTMAVPACHRLCSPYPPMTIFSA